MDNKNQEMNLDYEILMQAYADKCKECVKFQIMATKLSMELEQFKQKNDKEVDDETRND